MRNKETSMQEHKEPYPSKWVRFEYDGNFSSRVIFDQELVGQMMGIVGAIPFPLIITEREKAESIARSEHAKGNPGAVLAIDAEAIDRRLRETQQQNPKDLGQKWYENEFCKELKRGVFESLQKWAQFMVAKNPNRNFIEKFRTRAALKTFFKTNRDRLVSIKDQN